jgi:hypothetical protein
MNPAGVALQLARINRALSKLMEGLVEQLAKDSSTGVGLPPMEAAILESLLDGRPLIAKKIAKASGYAYCSRLRAVLADLCRRGFIVNGPDGYSLAPATNRPPQTTPSRLNGTNGHAAETE